MSVQDGINKCEVQMISALSEFQVSKEVVAALGHAGCVSSVLFAALADERAAMRVAI